jgi:hypothetical protein
MIVNVVMRLWVFVAPAYCVAAANGGHRQRLSGLPKDAVLAVDKDAEDTLTGSSASKLGLPEDSGLSQLPSNYHDSEEPLMIDGKVVITNQCGVAMEVQSDSDKQAICPPQCPFYASDKTDDSHCTFVCTTAEQCAAFNPKAPVADMEMQPPTCRAPNANFCKEYDLSGVDRCLKCKNHYILHEGDGQCYFEYRGLLWGTVITLVVVFVLFTAWMINLGCRKVNNDEGLQEGLEFRSACKLRQSKQDNGRRPLWPLSTDLRRQEVAGPGMMLHFHFQFNLILWAAGVGVAWIVVSYLEDPVFWGRLPDLMVLGTRKMGMPRENCILVKWGYETQQELMWIKIWFLLILYVVTFALCIVHGVRQMHLYEAMDAQNTTMTDFAAVLTGLPTFYGVELAEDIVKKEVELQTGEKVVGVSIAWDFNASEEEVMQKAKGIVYYADNEKREQEAKVSHREGADLADQIEHHNPAQKMLFDVESSIFGPEEEVQHSEEEILKDLDEMTSTEFAFVVFETEDSRNKAVSALEQAGGLKIRDTVAVVDHVRVEPDTVYWENFGHSSVTQKAIRLFMGFGVIFLALLVWTVCFYGPYAWSLFNFNYDNGQQPGMVYSMSFSMVIVLGNVIMYEVCARVSDFVGFHFRDNRETCYMILYTISCTFNILLDFVTTYYTVWEVSKGLGFRTYWGKKVEEITHFTEAFETYAMQRQLGENTFMYAFPSTFLIPFLIEPVVTIYVPLKLGAMIVRSHPEIVGQTAEGWLAAAPMDMGRYADCLLNVVLAVLVLYFPGGWTWRMYLAMAFSHVYIYAFDHWKVLRNIPACTYASMDLDWWSQVIMAPCVGMIFSCLIFKANHQGYGIDFDGFELIGVCTAGALAHIFIHVMVLTYVVPYFRHEVVGDNSETTTFKDCASVTACSWFTCNPVHCLRSKYKYKHSPECMYYVPGKDHCLKVNPAANVFFTGSREKGEDYAEVSVIHDVTSEVEARFLQLFESARSGQDKVPEEKDEQGLTKAQSSKMKELAARARAKRQASETHSEDK